MKTLVFPFLLLGSFFLASWGQGEAVVTHPTEATAREIIITGVIAMTGNDPFLKLIVQQDQGKTYEIIGEYKNQLSRRQAQTVTVSGIVEKEAIGPGFPAQLRVLSIRD